MTHIDNISHILEHGITHQSSINCNPNYVNIGNSSLIERRNRMDIVTVDGHTYSLKDYIPLNTLPQIRLSVQAKKPQDYQHKLSHQNQ